jgi:uncharacterized protein YlzI (FlbEa/FlbD family)
MAKNKKAPDRYVELTSEDFTNFSNGIVETSVYLNIDYIVRIEKYLGVDADSFKTKIHTLDNKWACVKENVDEVLEKIKLVQKNNQYF